MKSFKIEDILTYKVFMLNMGNITSKYTNNNCKPMEIEESPWLYENDTLYKTNRTITDAYNIQQDAIKKNICIQDGCHYNAKSNYYCGYHKKKAYNISTGLIRDNLLLEKPELLLEGTKCICGCEITHKIINTELVDIGKWMLYYKKDKMNDKWKFAQQLYRENKLNGILSMKCSTAYKNPRATNHDDGIIILYCANSYDEQYILEIGKNILNMFNYNDNHTIYYKTDSQTSEGTQATGVIKNHTYKLKVNLYVNKCLLIDD